MTIPGSPAVAEWQERLIHFIYYLIPNLENFNIRGRVVYNLPLGDHYVLFTSLHGAAFVGAYLLVACLWFNKRDFI